MPAIDKYGSIQEREINQKMADRINRHWANHGKQANAKVVRLTLTNGRVSRKYWTVKSDVSILWLV